MSTVRETCILTFNTSLDSTRLVRIPEPRPNLTQTAVTNAASLFIEADPFDETIGRLESLARADIIRETHIVLILKKWCELGNLMFLNSHHFFNYFKSPVGHQREADIVPGTKQVV